jgi:hypothetical protein
MPIATKNNAIIVKDGKLAENCSCCGAGACTCPENCTIGMQFVSPAQADIGVCGPSCVATFGSNPACPPVVNTISDSGERDTPAGRVIVSYTTTLNAVGDSTNFRNGVTKDYAREFNEGLRESVYASLRYSFVYGCDNTSQRLPFLYTRVVLEMAHYEGFRGFLIGRRTFTKARDFIIDQSAYRCSPSAGRMCSNRSPAFNPDTTKEFLPAVAVFNFSQDAINGMAFAGSSSQFGEQSLIGEVYNSHFSSFTATLVLSERNTCNPLP